MQTAENMAPLCLGGTVSWLGDTVHVQSDPQVEFNVRSEASPAV